MAKASFEGYIVANTLIVIAINNGVLFPSYALSAPGILPDTVITKQTSGVPGGAGSYIVNRSQTLAPTLTITADPIPATGPDLPFPLPGSNAIGQFVIGVSPAGDIPPFNVWTTVMSQYANSPILMQLILNMFAYLDQTQNFSNFFDLIWNVDTAQGYGLDVWGRIVGINRVLTAVVGSWFGWAEGHWSSFGQDAFWSGHPLTQNFILSDEAYRNLILAKAFANITDGSIASINRMLTMMFAHRGNAYVTEGNPPQIYFGFQEEHNAAGFNQAPFYNGEPYVRMTLAYTFKFKLTSLDLAIINSGVLPKPTGVLANVVQYF